MDQKDRPQSLPKVELDMAATTKEGPLKLLDLPLDVLKCIIKEVGDCRIS